ncbi:MAG: hypothetical protein GX247_01375 [Mollicutes bacterium]|jgi:hypothetical protein|nr:hypothetical protein [Mollicutes bacterium]
MKEAAGEANLTVVAIILIGVIAAVVTPLITNMVNTSKEKSCCTTAGGVWKNNRCQNTSANTFDNATYQACLSG